MDSVNIKDPDAPQGGGDPNTPQVPAVNTPATADVPHFKLKAIGFTVFRNRMQLKITAEALQKDAELLQWFSVHHADCFTTLPDFSTEL